MNIPVHLTNKNWTSMFQISAFLTSYAVLLSNTFFWVNKQTRNSGVAFIFSSLFSLQQHSCQTLRLFEILRKAIECWRSSPRRKLRIFLRCQPEHSKSEEGCMYGLVKQALAGTELVFFCCQFWGIQRRGKMRTAIFVMSLEITDF